MNSSELRNKIALAPDAVVIEGTLRIRQKKTDAGLISSLTPHYATRGCPTALYDEAGNIINPAAQGLSIEAVFDRDATADRGRLTSYYEKPFHYLHMMLGADRSPPTNAEAKALREASAIFTKLAGQPTYMVALPYLTTGQYGVALARYIPLAFFSRDAKEPEALWVNPEAVKVRMLNHAIPTNQLIRSFDAEPEKTANEAAPEWYAELHKMMASATGLTGLNLHNHVISSYATQLILQKRATTLVEANRIAREEYDQYKKAHLAKAGAAAPKSAPDNDAPLPAASPKLSKSGQAGQGRRM